MENRLETRQRIINAAMDLFAYNSYTRTGLAEIARKANALPGSLYHYFPTKEHVLAAVLEERKRLLWPEVLEPIWSRIDDPIERIFGLMDGYRQMLLMTEFSHGCPIGNLALELCDSHPNSRKLIAENFDNWLKAVEQCFIDAAERLPQGTDPRQLAIFTLTTMEGAVMLARTYRDLRAYDTAISVLRDHIDRLVAAETDWNHQPQNNRASQSET